MNEDFINIKHGIAGGILVAIVIIWLLSFGSVSAGHVGVKSFFGKVNPNVLEEGVYIKNPLAKVTQFDLRQKTLKDVIEVSARDQLRSKFDISIQFRLIKNKAVSMLKDTGTQEEVVAVHLSPHLRSSLREIGKSVEHSEDFFKEEVLQRIQSELLSSLSETLKPKGILVEGILIRDIVLPPIIQQAVKKKKAMAQEKGVATELLEKFKIDQERKEAQANAEKKAEIIEAEKKKAVALIFAQSNLDAAMIEAEKKKKELLIGAQARLEAAELDSKAVIVKANAAAAAKERMIKALTLDGLIKIESISALRDFQQGNHFVITDGKSTNPLPFMNLTPTK